jgi:hypothetical protein
VAGVGGLSAVSGGMRFMSGAMAAACANNPGPDGTPLVTPPTPDARTPPAGPRHRRG